MNEPVKAFLAILNVEMHDLEEDLKLLMSKSEEKHKKEQISNYVYLENLAVIKQELFGVNGIARRFEKTNVDEYKDLDSLIMGLKSEMLNEKAKDLLPEGVIHMVERKLKKVQAYVESPSH